MLLRPLTVAAGLLAGSAVHAFLLPPEVSKADIQIADTVEAIAPQIAESRVVKLECPGCPVLVTNRRGSKKELTMDWPSHLELTFSIDHQSDFDRLLVNGFELYPSNDVLRLTRLEAPQVVERDTDGLDREKRHHRDGEHDRDHHRRPYRPHHLTPEPQPLGFTSQVKWGNKDADGQFRLVEIYLQISEVGTVYVDEIPSITLKLIEDPNGRLLISQVEKGAPSETNKPVEVTFVGEPQECTICKWMAAASERLRKLKPFGHCRNQRMKGGMSPAVADLPQPHAHHHHHHHGHAPFHKHRLGQLFKHVASHIIVPVLIGIVAGVSAGLIGMAVGTVVVSMWRFFFRRHSHRHCRARRAHRRAARKEAAVAEEQSGLMEHQDPPPSYEEQDAAKTVA